MKDVDVNDRAACSFQGRVFERSASLLRECGSAVFVRRFMRSDIARRVDENGSFDVGATVDGVVHDVDAVFAGRPYGSELYPPETLFWMGYLYRYWCFSVGVSSTQAYRTCSAREMSGLYFAYHTLDPAQCVERILESKGLPVEESDQQRLRRGVEALRRLRATSK